MTVRVFNVLFLCTGNSARSILAEAILNNFAYGKFRTYSAGSHPAGQVNPLTLALLEEMHLPTAGLRSKSWAEFVAPGAPGMDFIFTVCDKAAGETCPVWPGHPITAAWGIADPAAVQGREEEGLRAFRRAQLHLSTRIRLFLSLPLEKLDRQSLQCQVQQLGKSP
jgi:arsenate reductase (thioredoxin)